MKLPRFAHLYCGFTIDLPYRHKIGWSLSAEKRWKDIKRELGKELGRDIDVWTLPVPILYARSCEQFIFRLFKSFKYNGLKTSTGRTEYFWSVNIFTFLTLWGALDFFGFQDGIYKAFFLSSIPVPLDGFLMILVIFIVQWALIAAFFFLGFYWLIF
jgi:hypothetical protein